MIPELAAKVREHFADMLQTPTGRYNQLAVIMHIKDRIRHGDYPDLADPLRLLSGRLL